TLIQSPRAVASAPSAAVPIASDREKVWQDFVAFVRREKKFLASHLEAGTALELSPSQLKVGIVERHHLNYLRDMENLSALTNLAKQFFAEDVTVDITGLAADDAARKNERLGTGAAERGERSAMRKGAVRTSGG